VPLERPGRRIKESVAARSGALTAFSRVRHCKETPPCGEAAAWSAPEKRLDPARIAWQRVLLINSPRVRPAAHRKRGAAFPGFHGRGGRHPARAGFAAIWRAPALIARNTVSPNPAAGISLKAARDSPNLAVFSGPRAAF
jgi:hypothetical protein